jgi:pimeloyl-ACP methyl ester carboxylesterase
MAEVRIFFSFKGGLATNNVTMPPLTPFFRAISGVISTVDAMSSPDFYARRLIRHTALPGRLRLALAGPARWLLRLGRIGAIRRIPADGACIDTWVVPPSPAARPRGTVLLVHGLWDSKARMLPLARKLAKAGFYAVLPDLRCHGKSTGTFVTYGFREKHDLAAVMQSLAADGVVSGEAAIPSVMGGGHPWPPPPDAAARDGRRAIESPTYVVGFSAGGCVAAQFAAMLPECRGLVLLAPVASARMIMRRMLKFLAPFKTDDACRQIIDRAGELADFDLDAASAVDAARRIACPTVVVHGLLDRTVPPEHGKAIFDALAGPKQFVPVRWAGHNSLLWGRSNWIVQQLIAFSDTDGGGKSGGQIGD